MSAHRSFVTVIGILFFLAGCLVVTAQNQAAARRLVSSLSTLTHANEVRELSSSEALRGWPVRLRGVVTHTVRSNLNAIFLQDETAGIYVDGIRDSAVQQGKLLEVEGVTGPGVFAPVVLARHWRVIGAGALPKARVVTAAEMRGGQLDSQWLEVGGIVRSVTPNQEGYDLELAMDGGLLRVILPPLAGKDVEGLVDSRVRVQGVCITKRNMNGQWMANYIGVAKWEALTKEEPASPSEKLPVWPIARLFRFPPAGADGHRVKVQGRVLCGDRGGTTFIQDATQAMQVQAIKAPRLSPGDYVEALGFLSGGGFYPVMEEAELTFIRHETVVEPQRAKVENMLNGQYGGQLVAIEGRLVDSVQRPEEAVLILEASHHLFVARLRKGLHAQAPVPPVGSTLLLSGVCVLPSLSKWEHAAPLRPGSFELLLPGASDMRVLHKPPWWTVRRTAGLLAIVTAVLAAAIIWVLMLRHRVRAQTRLIESKIQREATLEERTRIARELHDTLMQGVAGIAFQLEAVATHLDATAQEAKKQLQLALAMVRHSLTDARRSVMNLRAQALESKDLPGALKEGAELLLRHSGVQFRFETRGEPRRLGASTESHLLRMGQEAVANALKYSLAHRIEIFLEFSPGTVCLKIEDFGKGFDPDALQQDNETHFGLRGMRERARLMNADFELQSHPGQGTTITVRVPLSCPLTTPTEATTVTL